MTEKKRQKKNNQQAFLNAYKTGLSITAAAAAAKVWRKIHYVWLETDPEYPEKFQEAIEVRNDALETEARRRAVEGLRKYKFGKDGEPLLHPVTGEPYYEHEYADVMLIFLMKGAMPEKYRDNSRVEMTGPAGGPIQVTEVVVCNREQAANIAASILPGLPGAS